MEGAWLKAEPGWNLANLPEAGDPRWVSFDVRHPTSVPRMPDGAWIRLTATNGWPAGAQVLVVESPPLGEFELHSRSGWSRATSSMNLDQLRGHGPGRLAFELPANLTTDEVLYLNVKPYPSLSGGFTLQVESRAEFVAGDARWLAFFSASLAIMLAMALMALCFAYFLGDLAYLTYALYLFCYGMIQCIQTGFAAVPMGWTWVAMDPRPWGISATCLAIVFAILFANRFMTLARHAPGLRRVLLCLAFFVAVVLLGGLVLPPEWQQPSRQLLNPMLIISGPLLVLTALVAALRGSRYGWYFLAGWTPLLLLTVLQSLRVLGVLRDGQWLGDACILAAVFEAIVLSLGLADRTLAMRRDRDRIASLAESDPLTATLNRRVWMERATTMIEDAKTSGRPVSLLFLDIDDFKKINDEIGHVAGDNALIALANVLVSELRQDGLVGRYGGEEFVVLLPGCGVTKARQLAEKLRVRVRDAAIPGVSGGGGLTVSMGIAERLGGMDLPDLLAAADRAMYDAKYAGRDRIHVAEMPSMASHAVVEGTP